MGISLVSIATKRMRRRSNLEVIGRILQVINDGDGCSSKNQIMYKAFLGSAQTSRYLKNIVANGFLEYNLTSQRYKLTENGSGFLLIYNEIDDMMNLSQSSDIGQYEAWIEEGEIRRRSN
jgi:predicted transcriptional regulator